jgi:hypothetical protein
LPDFPVSGASNPWSGAGAATALAYSGPDDSGYRNADSSGAKGAAVAWAKGSKMTPLWAHDSGSSTQKAGILHSPPTAAGAAARDYQMSPVWIPARNSNASKAALLASEHKATKTWLPKGVKYDGNTTSLDAMKIGAELPPQLDRRYTKEEQSNLLKGATSTMAIPRRGGSGSAPESATIIYPGQANATDNVPNAAEVANREPSTHRKKAYIPAGSGEAPGGSGGADEFDSDMHIALTIVERGSYSAHAPIQTETDDKKRSDTLRAAAIVTAKQLYKAQSKEKPSKLSSDLAEESSAPYGLKPSNSSEGKSSWDNLQVAAQKLAGERLARLHDEHQQYRDYYKEDVQRGNKLDSRSRYHQLPQNSESDKYHSQAIRSDMGILNHNLAKVDQEKRVKDRAALLAAAQRNVATSMAEIDNRIARGKTPVSDPEQAIIPEDHKPIESPTSGKPRSRFINIFSRKEMLKRQPAQAPG